MRNIGTGGMGLASVGWALMLCAALLYLSCFAGRANAVEARKQALVLECLTEQPVAYPGQSITLRAWVTEGDGVRVQDAPGFTWRASTGTISGGNQATWRLPDTQMAAGDDTSMIRRLSATVQVEMAQRDTAYCTLEVLMVNAPAEGVEQLARERSARVTARGFLVRGKKPPVEYGLNSYLLFSVAPRSEAERERYLNAIEAFLRVLTPLEDFLSNSERASRLNLTMLPTTVAITLPPGFDQQETAGVLGSQILQAYDYARAQILLSEFNLGPSDQGPYLIAIDPRSPERPRSTLVIDMSGVSAPLIWEWMRFFCWRAAQERSWDQVALKRLGLGLRNIFAAVGGAAPILLSSFDNSVHTLKSR